MLFHTCTSKEIKARLATALRCSLKRRGRQACLIPSATAHQTISHQCPLQAANIIRSLFQASVLCTNGLGSDRNTRAFFLCCSKQLNQLAYMLSPTDGTSVRRHLQVCAWSCGKTCMHDQVAHVEVKLWYCSGANFKFDQTAFLAR